MEMAETLSRMLSKKMDALWVSTKKIYVFVFLISLVLGLSSLCRQRNTTVTVIGTGFTTLVSIFVFWGSGHWFGKKWQELRQLIIVYFLFQFPLLFKFIFLGFGESSRRSSQKLCLQYFYRGERSVFFLSVTKQ
jgi:hypothetical protein